MPHPVRKRRLPATAAGTARKRAFGNQGALKRRKAVTPRQRAEPVLSSPAVSVPKRRKRR